MEHRDSSGGGGQDRPRRRAVDDRGVGHRPRGVPRPRVRAARRAVRDGAALGEPAGEGQDGAAALPGASSSAEIPMVTLPGGARHACASSPASSPARRARRGRSRRSRSGTCASTATQRDRARDAGRLHDGARRAAAAPCASTAPSRSAPPRSRCSTARARASAIDSAQDATALLLCRRADRRADRRQRAVRDEHAPGDPPGDARLPDRQDGPPRIAPFRPARCELNARRHASAGTRRRVQKHPEPRHHQRYLGGDVILLAAEALERFRQPAILDRLPALRLGRTENRIDGTKTPPARRAPHRCGQTPRPARLCPTAGGS